MPQNVAKILKLLKTNPSSTCSSTKSDKDNYRIPRWSVSMTTHFPSRTTCGHFPGSIGSLCR